MFFLQIVGPFSFRVESTVTIDPKKQDHFVRVDDSVFAIDWALKVLGSAKATAWYSPKHQEAMVELRFFETWRGWLIVSHKHDFQRLSFSYWCQWELGQVTVDVTQCASSRQFVDVIKFISVSCIHLLKTVILVGCSSVHWLKQLAV